MVSMGPKFDIITWTGYDINMIFFIQRLKMKKVLCRVYALC